MKAQDKEIIIVDGTDDPGFGIRIEDKKIRETAVIMPKRYRRLYPVANRFIELDEEQLKRFEIIIKESLSSGKHNKYRLTKKLFRKRSRWQK